MTAPRNSALARHSARRSLGWPTQPDMMDIDFSHNF